MGRAKEDRARFFTPKGHAKTLLEAENNDDGDIAINTTADRGLDALIKRMDIERPLSDVWMNLVRSYTIRQLNVSNKLPAISGIATEFHALSGDDYYAGLWKAKLPQQLLWQCVGASNFGMSLPSEYLAPTWSWATVNGEVSFEVEASIGVRTASFEQSPELVILSTSTKVKNSKVPFGEVVDGRL
jgi:hypothetical protein